MRSFARRASASVRASQAGSAGWLGWLLGWLGLAWLRLFWVDSSWIWLIWFGWLDSTSILAGFGFWLGFRLDFGLDLA